ncbi:P-type domain-containing protein [Balamuthia mandrillaris]
MSPLPSLLLLLALFFFVASAAPVCNPGGDREDCCAGQECSESLCVSQGCCWSPERENSPFPWCYHSNPPTKGYQITRMEETACGVEATLELIDGPSKYGIDISPLQMNVYLETESRLRVKIFDPNNKRWEVSNVIQSPPCKHVALKTLYSISYTTSPFGFAITRRSNGETIFNTTSASYSRLNDTTRAMFNGLIFEDQYIEISTQLNDTNDEPNIFGLGERVHSLRLDSSGKFYTLFTTDSGTPPEINLYGHHPFYLEHRNSSKLSHGVFLLNSNGMDVFVGPKQITYKIIGGILDFYFFLGPSPSDVIGQYMEVIGNPYMPPYWALGFHQCRYGYNTIQEVEAVVANYSKHSIPLDTIWTDIDYMELYEDFTFDPKRYPLPVVQSFVKKLHQNGMQYIVITDCGIPNNTDYEPWNKGSEMDVWIKDRDDKPFIGKVWPGFTAWPDWFHPNATSYWTQMIQIFLETVPVDGLWIDMNELSNFCNGACQPDGQPQMKKQSTRRQLPSSFSAFNPNNPPYPINNKGDRLPLNTKTADMDARHYNNTLEYDVHSMFGFMEGIATRVALEKVRGKRAVVISRSTFPGHGYHASHWLGDNQSDWDDLYYSIPGMLNFQMFGIPLVGADICGFNGDTTEELCARWMQLGAFYPFSRNHNSIGTISQEPYLWPSVAAISRQILRTRYSLLPYYYTLFFRANTKGESMVARPIFFEFPEDSDALFYDRQFLIGPALLVSPVLQQGQTELDVYFPKDVWYDFWSNEQVTNGKSAQWITLDTPLDKIQLHVRAGHIIPMQVPALTTQQTRLNPYSLLVASSLNGSAKGTLFVDDGDSLDTIAGGAYALIEYTLSNFTQLNAKVVRSSYSFLPRLSLGKVTIMGVPKAPTSAQLNGQSTAFNYNSTSHSLQFTFNISMGRNWSLFWRY